MMTNVQNQDFGYSVTCDGYWAAVGNPNPFRWNPLTGSIDYTGSVEVYKYNINTDVHDRKGFLYRPLRDEEKILLSTERANTGLTGPYYILHTEYTGSIPYTADKDLEVDAKGYFTASEDGYGWSIDLRDTLLAVGCPYYTSEFTFPQTQSFFFTGSVFNRIVLPQTITVDVTYQLRLIYDLRLTFTPNYRRYVNPPISGWANTSGTESLQVINIATVNVDGSPGANGTFASDVGVLDPASYHGYNNYYCVAALSDVATAPASVGTYVNRYLNGSSTAGIGSANGTSTYVNGSYFKYKYSSFGLTIGNSTNIRSIAMGAYYSGGAYPNGNYQCLVFVFDVPQTKTNTQLAFMTYKFSWSRTIGNGI